MVFVCINVSDCAAQAYINVRQAGNDELGDLVLSLSSELQGFNYRETFTNAFEVYCLPSLSAPGHRSQGCCGVPVG